MSYTGKLYREDVYLNPWKQQGLTLLHPKSRPKRRTQLKRQSSLNEASRLRLFQLINASIYILSFAGFCYQVYDICNTYLKYETGSFLKIDIDDELLAPDMSFCMRYVDILSLDLSQEQRETKEGIRRVQRNLTLRQIFDWTPAADEITSECFYREPDHSYLVKEQKDGNACEAIFNITKFYLQEYICYRYHIKGSERDDRKFTYRNIAFSLTHSGLFYGIFINQSRIPFSNQCKVIVHEPDTFPVDSAAYAPYFYRRVNGSGKYDLVKADYGITEIIMLPSPYDTHCIAYYESEELKKNCVNKCLGTQSAKKFQKVPFTIIQETPVNLKHISGEDLENETFASQLRRIEETCDWQCRWPACAVEYHTTRIQKEERGRDSVFSIIVQAPGAPSITVSSEPRQFFREFAIYATSTFGTWFGWSILNFNPKSIRLIWEKKGSKRTEGQEMTAKSSPRLQCEKCKLTIYEIKKEILSTRRLTTIFMPSSQGYWNCRLKSNYCSYTGLTMSSNNSRRPRVKQSYLKID